MRVLFTFLILFYFTSTLIFSQSVRVGPGSGNCGTSSNPCPSGLCTGSSSLDVAMISVNAGQRINFSFSQGGTNPCGSSFGYEFETNETLTLSWPPSNSVTLYTGISTGGSIQNGSEATGSGCYFNNTGNPIVLTFTVSSNRRDEAVILTYSLTSGDAMCTPLPVTLSSFQIKGINKLSLLTFSTASETNNDHFTIERSVDGRSFDAIGEIKGAGNSNEEKRYEFTDENPLAGINYYRIKQTDYDGQYSYSEIKSVRHKGDRYVTVTPRNTDGRLNITTDMDSYSMVVYNSAGQEVQRHDELSGDQNVSIEALQAGIYFVKVVSGTESETMKIMKY